MDGGISECTKLGISDDVCIGTLDGTIDGMSDGISKVMKLGMSGVSDGAFDGYNLGCLTEYLII